MKAAAPKQVTDGPTDIAITGTVKLTDDGNPANRATSRGSGRMPDELTTEDETTDVLNLVRDDEPSPEPAKPAEEAKPVETPPPADEVKEDKPAPGTPDKALQKVQQDLSATNRKVDALLEKVDAGQELTGSEVKQLQEGKRKLDELREKLKADSYDVIDDSDKLARAVVEQDDEVSALKRTVQGLQAELEPIRQEAFWAAEAKKYPDVDARAVWQKAVEDTQAWAQYGPEMHRLRASEAYAERCGNAAKSVAAKNKGVLTSAIKPAPATTTPTADTRISSGGSSPGRAQMSEDEQLMQQALSLVRETD